ncbi:hypothetical protein ZWY2020_037365 [Hordeum vulgare]|nr:hypothetical protein ZWY2020_037365 [Hordeum vulgare]
MWWRRPMALRLEVDAAPQQRRREVAAAPLQRQREQQQGRATHPWAWGDPAPAAPWLGSSGRATPPASTETLPKAMDSRRSRSAPATLVTGFCHFHCNMLKESAL